MNKNELRAVVESLLFMSTEPLTVSDIKKIIDGVGKPSDREKPADGAMPQMPSPENDAVAQLEQMKGKLEGEISKGEIKDCLMEIVGEYRQGTGRGFELVEVAKGFQFRTRPEVTPFVKALYKAAPNRLSAPGLETLAIAAYQQPVTRARVEEIRGVESGGVLRTLLERDLVRVVGRSEDPGRPILYGTTAAFLEIFGLHALSDLPTLKDLELIDQGAPVSQGGSSEGDETAEGLFAEPSDSDFGAEDEGSHELIEDLENSLRGLRDLEKKIFTPDENQPTDQPSMSNDKVQMSKE
ncbi:MAG: SMC-Scp complex subunit ScpB [Deltaproteobacteria bacterium]|nr:SMC-Scp complex subunit ScpB [Deltaproteobacteria bacterium]